MSARSSTLMSQEEIEMVVVVSDANTKVRRKFFFQRLGPVYTAPKNFILCIWKNTDKFAIINVSFLSLNSHLQLKKWQSNQLVSCTILCLYFLHSV